MGSTDIKPGTKVTLSNKTTKKTYQIPSLVLNCIRSNITFCGLCIFTVNTHTSLSEITVATEAAAVTQRHTLGTVSFGITVALGLLWVSAVYHNKD